MIEKDPLAYPLLTYLWVVGLAMWGGAVNYIRKVKAGQARAFNLPELVGELVISGFTGMLTFWLCEAASINPLMAAALVGISGHMGSRAIFGMERILESKLGVRGAGPSGAPSDMGTGDRDT